MIPKRTEISPFVSLPCFLWLASMSMWFTLLPAISGWYEFQIWYAEFFFLFVRLICSFPFIWAIGVREQSNAVHARKQAKKRGTHQEQHTWKKSQFQPWAIKCILNNAMRIIFIFVCCLLSVHCLRKNHHNRFFVFLSFVNTMCFFSYIFRQFVACMVLLPSNKFINII